MRKATQIILDTSAWGSLPWGPAGERRWAAVRNEVLRRLAPAEITPVADPESAGEVAREAACLGFEHFIAAGGPPLANGVLEGLMRLAPAQRSQRRRSRMLDPVVARQYCG